MTRPSHTDPILDQPKNVVPIFSVVGLGSLLLSLVLFSIALFQNSQTVDRLEEIQKAQVEFTAARAPATKTALCNIVLALTLFAPAREGAPPERVRVDEVLKQNLEALDCARAFVELPGGIPFSPPPVTRP